MNYCIDQVMNYFIFPAKPEVGVKEVLGYYNKEIYENVYKV